MLVLFFRISKNGERHASCLATMLRKLTSEYRVLRCSPCKAQCKLINLLELEIKLRKDVSGLSTPIRSCPCRLSSPSLIQTRTIKDRPKVLLKRRKVYHFMVSSFTLPTLRKVVKCFGSTFFVLVPILTRSMNDSKQSRRSQDPIMRLFWPVSVKVLRL